MISIMKNCALAVFGRSWRINRVLEPVVLHLTLTDRCNLKCRMCNIWQKNEKKDVPLDLLRNIASSKYGRNIRVLDITGGEPFLADIKRAVDQFDIEKLRAVLISTNGVKTEAITKTVRELLDDGEYSLHLSISLDGRKDYHDFVRGITGTFDRLKSTVYELKKIRERNPRLRVGVKMTLMPDNVSEIIPVYRFATENDLDYTAKPADVFEFLENEDMDFSFTGKQTDELCGALHHIVACEKARSLPGARFWARMYHASNIIFHEKLIRYMCERSRGENPRPPAPCLSSFISIMLHSDGRAYSCPTLMKEIGDVSDRGFDAIWKSRAINDIRKFIRRGECACFSQCDQMPSILVNNKVRLMWLVLRTYCPTKLKRKRCLVYEN